MAVFGSKERVDLRPVQGFGGKYRVGSDGSVWRDGSRLVAVDGKYVSLSWKGEVRRVKICYLVARAFVENAELRPWVVHLNGDARDNRAENLAWSERKEELRGRQPWREEIAVRVWRKVGGEFVGAWPRLDEACRELGVSRASALRVLRGEAKSAKGYVFER